MIYLATHQKVDPNARYVGDYVCSDTRQEMQTYLINNGCSELLNSIVMDSHGKYTTQTPPYPSHVWSIVEQELKTYKLVPMT